jgi:hypothetical protein
MVRASLLQAAIPDARFLLAVAVLILVLRYLRYGRAPGPRLVRQAARRQEPGLRQAA